MNPLAEVGLLVARELRRSVRSGKGIVLLLLCAMMATGTALIVVGAQQAADEAARHAVRRGSGVAMMMAGSEANHLMLESWYDATVATRLREVPRIVLVMVMGTVMFAPAFVAMLSFDSVSAELQFRSVRYWTVRMRRASYFAGKVAGVFALAALATLVVQGIAWAIAIARGAAPLVETVGWGVLLWASTLPIVLAWVSLAVFISSFARTPMLALMLNFMANFALWLGWVIGHNGDLKWLRWVFPNFQDVRLLSSDPVQALVGLGACVAFSALFWLTGGVIFQRRDL